MDIYGVPKLTMNGREIRATFLGMDNKERDIRVPVVASRARPNDPPASQEFFTVEDVADALRMLADTMEG